MFRYIKHSIAAIAVLAAFALVGNGDKLWAQESAPAETAAEDDAPAIEEPETDSEDEEVNVDDGSYIDAAEEDFRPSEEISSDQSITFPTDI